MKTKRVIPLAILVCAAVGAGLWLAFQHRQESADRTVSIAASPPAANDAAGWEYKTVEATISDTNLRQHMAEWQREGWTVLSMSKPLPQPDGTVQRKVELRRARQ